MQIKYVIGLLVFQSLIISGNNVVMKIGILKYFDGVMTVRVILLIGNHLLMYL